MPHPSAVLAGGIARQHRDESSKRAAHPSVRSEEKSASPAAGGAATEDR